MSEQPKSGQRPAASAQRGPESGFAGQQGRGQGAPPFDTGLPLGLILRNGWQLLKSFPRLTCLFLLVSLLYAATSAGAPLLFGLIVNNLQKSSAPKGAASPETGGPRAGAAPAKPTSGLEQSLGELSVSSLYIIWSSMLLGGIALRIAGRYAQTRLDTSMAIVLRDRLFNVILRQRPPFFHQNDSGSLSTIVNQMAVETQMALRQAILDPVIQLLSLVLTAGSLMVALSQLPQQHAHLQARDWTVFGGVLIFSLLTPWLVSKSGMRLQKTSSRVMDQHLATSSLVNGAFGCPEEIQAFGAEAIFAKKHRKSLDALQRAGISQILAAEYINALSSSPAAVAQLALVGYAIAFAARSADMGVNAGFIVSIVQLAPELMSPLQSLSVYIVMMRNSLPSVEKVLGLLQKTPFSGSTDGSSSAPANGDLTLAASNLVFRYRPDLPPVFNTCSFEFPPGKITGLVAKMGQGKTTFFRLALRFYDAEGGKVLVAGRPTSEWDVATLRQRVALMSQFPAFFHDTLRENLLIANPEASDEQIESLCRATGIWRILESRAESEQEKIQYPNPLDRQFAEGRMLSGGEKKLLALTRCLLRSPTHLFLDEPTVGMDNQEKFGLIPNLQQACAGRTAVVVDHDVRWLLRFCDHFIVLDKGVIVQKGGKELAEQPGLFSELLKMDVQRAGPSVKTDGSPAAAMAAGRPPAGAAMAARA